MVNIQNQSSPVHLSLSFISSRDSKSYLKAIFDFYMLKKSRKKHVTLMFHNTDKRVLLMRRPITCLPSSDIHSEVTLTPLLLGSENSLLFFCSRPDDFLNTRRMLGLDIGESLESRLLFTIGLLTALLSELLAARRRLQFRQEPTDFEPFDSERRIHTFST